MYKDCDDSSVGENGVNIIELGDEKKWRKIKWLIAQEKGIMNTGDRYRNQLSIPQNLHDTLITIQEIWNGWINVQENEVKK